MAARTFVFLLTTALLVISEGASAFGDTPTPKPGDSLPPAGDDREVADRSWLDKKMREAAPAGDAERFMREVEMLGDRSLPEGARLSLMVEHFIRLHANEKPENRDPYCHWAGGRHAMGLLYDRLDFLAHDIATLRVGFNNPDARKQLERDGKFQDEIGRAQLMWAFDSVEPEYEGVELNTYETSSEALARFTAAYLLRRRASDRAFLSGGSQPRFMTALYRNLKHGNPFVRFQAALYLVEMGVLRQEVRQVLRETEDWNWLRWRSFGFHYLHHGKCHLIPLIGQLLARPEIAADAELAKALRTKLFWGLDASAPEVDQLEAAQYVWYRDYAEKKATAANILLGREGEIGSPAGAILLILRPDFELAEKIAAKYPRWLDSQHAIERFVAAALLYRYQHPPVRLPRVLEIIDDPAMAAADVNLYDALRLLRHRVNMDPCAGEFPRTLFLDIFMKNHADVPFELRREHTPDPNERFFF